MRKRYYNKSTLTESLNPGPDTVELPDDHIFWKPKPKDKRFTYDAENIPSGFEDIPLPTVGSDEAIWQSIRAQNITTFRMITAMLRAHNGNSTSVDNILASLAQIASNHGTTVEYVLQLIGYENEEE